MKRFYTKTGAVCRARRLIARILRITAISLFIGVVGCSGRVEKTPAPTGEGVAYWRSAADPQQTTQATVAMGTGWGTFKGQIFLSGDFPALSPLSAGNVAVCNQHTIPDERLVVGPNKGVKNFLVFARKVNRIHEDYNKSEGQPVFDQNQCLFTSHVMGVYVRDALLIKNSDAVAHNTNISPSGDTPTNTTLAPGGSLPYQLSRAQTKPVEVTCSIHPWMKAYLLPRKDPYFSVTDEQGNFELKNLPAGEQIIVDFWHESAPDVSVSADKPNLNVARGNLTLKLEEGQILEVKYTVDRGLFRLN